MFSVEVKPSSKDMKKYYKPTVCTYPLLPSKETSQGFS